ncbi:MAG: hypothetical protein N4A49_09645 [Marinifilaceae bacterium]|jgi:hypothetical protein|nr:hypothetical protein [Marinifilaceae bacterium]
MIKITDQEFLKLLRTKKYKSALRNKEGKPDVNGEYLDYKAPAIQNKNSLDIRSRLGWRK